MRPLQKEKSIRFEDMPLKDKSGHARRRLHLPTDAVRQRL
jgi:hypothetical protein